MAAITGNILPFLFYWLILFVTCFSVVEFGQNYLYDESTRGVGWKVAIGSAILSLLLTYTRPRYDVMFTSEIGWTVLLAVLSFAIFTLLFQFQPHHGAAIGILSMLLVSGIATMGVTSLIDPAPPLSPTVTRPSKPLRQQGTKAAPLVPVGPPVKR